MNLYRVSFYWGKQCLHLFEVKSRDEVSAVLDAKNELAKLGYWRDWIQATPIWFKVEVIRFGLE